MDLLKSISYTNLYLVLNLWIMITIISIDILYIDENCTINHIYDKLYKYK